MLGDGDGDGGGVDWAVWVRLPRAGLLIALAWSSSLPASKKPWLLLLLLLTVTRSCYIV